MESFLDKHPRLRYIIFLLVTMLYVLLSPLIFMVLSIGAFISNIQKMLSWLWYDVKRHFKNTFDLSGVPQAEKYLREKISAHLKKSNKEEFM